MSNHVRRPSPNTFDTGHRGAHGAPQLGRAGAAADGRLAAAERQRAGWGKRLWHPEHPCMEYSVNTFCVIINGVDVWV